MKIALNIGTEAFKEKPGAFPGHLRNQLCSSSSIVEVEPEDLMRAIESGRSFTPAVMSGPSGSSWKSQQIICADIDNEIEIKDAAGRKIKIPLPDPLTSAQALAIMAGYGITPYFMYWSFRNSERCIKYRVVVILDRPLRDPEAAQDLTARLTGIFNAAKEHCADTQITDNARIFYGSRPGSVFYTSGQITQVETLQELPEPLTEKPYTENPDTEKPDAAAERPSERKNGPDRYEQPKPGKNAPGRTLEELQALFEYDKNHFDLSGYIARTTASRPRRTGSVLFFNPCPLCGHNDDFQVTGSLYHCYSASGGSGGSIIDYLMNRENLDTGAAIEKFKFDIMGYSRAEWQAAYIAEQKNGAKTAPGALTGSQSDFRGSDGDFTDKREKAPESGRRAHRAGGMEEFLQKIQTTAYKPYKTGLAFFDDMLGGGILRQTVLLILAAPGTGKTTLCQQIAEGIAKNGKPIIFLNLEMSREQMLAKSISARAARSGAHLSALDVLQGYRWTPEQRQAVIKAAGEYQAEVAPFLKYNPDGISSDLDELKQYLSDQGAAATAAGAPAPAVILDYLHLVSTNRNIDAQELIKHTVKAIKDYCIKFDTFAIVISATNRLSNSSGRITLESGRDSSSIEYGCDAQISLNFEDIDNGQVKPSQPDKVAALQMEERRRMVLRVLKSRLYETGRFARAYFNAATNTFYGTDDFMPANGSRTNPFEESKPAARRREVRI